MRMKLYCTIILFFLTVALHAQTIYTDVLVIGGGTGGTAAGIRSARQKVKTIIVEPTT